MTTIKGFRGLSGSIGGGTGDLDGPGTRRLVISGQSDDSTILTALQDSSTQTGSLSSDEPSKLSITDQLSVAAIDSVESATTALTEIITKIQELGEKIGSEQSGTAEHTALSNEIDALTNQYNSILQTDSRYVTSDLSAFTAEAASLSSSSTYLNSISLTAAASEAVLTGDIATINAAIAPSLAALTVFSSQSASYDSDISSISGELSILANSMYLLETELTGYSSDYATYGAEIAAAQNQLTSLSSSQSVLNDAYNAVVVAQTPIATQIYDINQSIAPDVATLSSYSSQSSSYAAARIGAGAAKDALASEISAISSVSNTAVSDVASSSSSRSLTSVQSDLRSLSLNEGLRVDFSTTGLSAVTNRILENRLTDLRQAGSTAGNSSAVIDEQASNSSAQATELLPAESESLKNISQAAEAVKAVSKSILKDPETALNALGEFDVTSVLQLLNPD